MWIQCVFMCVKITEHCVNIKHYKAASSAPVIVHFAANLTTVTVLKKKKKRLSVCPLFAFEMFRISQWLDP